MWRKPPHDGGPNHARGPPVMDPQGKSMSVHHPGRSGGTESPKEAFAVYLHQMDGIEALLPRGDSLKMGIPVSLSNPFGTTYSIHHRQSPLP